MANEIPALFCVDVEPDPRELGRSVANTWDGFEKLLIAIGPLRDLLAGSSRSDAHLNWFLRMDPQIAHTWGSSTWVAETYEPNFAALTTAGDQLGLHPHSWRWDAGQNRWTADRADEDWVEHCVASSLAAFRDAFGAPCEAHRHGDRQMTTHVARLLEDSGVRVDLTVEPGMPSVWTLVPGELSTGWIEHLTPAPHSPYYPAESDFRTPSANADGGLMMIPLSMGLDIETAVEEGRYLPTGRWDTLILWDEPGRFQRRLDRLLAKPDLTHVAFAIRSDLPLYEQWNAFETNIRTLCAHPRAGDLAWSTAKQARENLARVAASSNRHEVATGSSRRTALWARGREDPGFLEGAEGEALDLICQLLAIESDARSVAGDELDANLEQLTAAEGRAADAQASVERLEHIERALRVDLDEARAQLEREVASREATAAALVEVETQLESIRATTTWRLRERALPLLRTLRRFAPRR